MIRRSRAAAVALGIAVLPAARAHPSTHPSLYVGPEDRSEVIGRAAREPMSRWWAEILASAERGLWFDLGANPHHVSRAPAARDLAFAAWLAADERFAEKAAEILLDVDPSSGWGEGHAAGGSALAYAEAYDFLAGSGHLAGSPETDREIRRRLLETARRMDRNPVINFVPNNWTIRYHSGLGALCLALAAGNEEHPPREVARWLGGALDQVLRVTALQEVGGAWAEGPGYLRYSAVTYVPFLTAWERRFGEDLLAGALFRRVHRFAVDLRLPHGPAPNIDDANVVGFPSALVARHQPEPGLHVWSGMRAAGPEIAGMRLHALLLYPDDIPPTPPVGAPSWWSPQAGTALFRTDWSEDATYLLVLGEHGPARWFGWGHEQADGSSFTLWSGDTPLLLDGGYFGWDERHLVAGAVHHNLFLVDGRGPAAPTLLRPTRGVDARLSSWFDEDSLASVTVTTHYHATDFERSFTVVDHDWIQITDDLSSRRLRPRTYALQLHGNGNEAKGTYTPLEDGGRWVAGEAGLVARVVAPPGVTLETGSDLHSLAYGDTTTHTVLRALTSAGAARFVTSIEVAADGGWSDVPRGAEVSRVRLVRGERGLAMLRARSAQSDAVDALLVATDPADGIDVDLGPWGRVESPADRIYLRLGEGRIRRSRILSGAAEVRVDGEEIAADRPRYEGAPLP